MDYEKAYNDALNLAKSYYGNGCNEFLDTIFPELSESEDERIRKLLVWQVHRNIEDETNDLAQSVYDGIKGHDPDLEESIEDWKRCLAYLEKQKEQKEIPLMNGDADLYFDNWIQHNDTTKRGCFEEGIRYAQRLQKRQKPAEWSEEDKRLCNLIARCIALGKKDGLVSDDDDIACLDLLKRKDTSLSEEDRKMIELIISELEQEGKDVNAPNLYKPEIDWLKSLRPQPKDKTYKEKDEAFKLGKHQLAIVFMNYLDSNRPEGKMSLSNGECEDINKAFKENDWAKIMRYIEKYSSHWKPSEEQMEALKRASTNEYISAKQFDILVSLYEQLKKLGVKEEPEYYQHFYPDC